MSEVPKIVNYYLPQFALVPDFKGDCRGLPTSWWFPPVIQNKQVRIQMGKAIDICNGCHAKQECLDFALTNVNVHGIWGGTTPTSRRGMNRSKFSSKFNGD